MLVLCTAHEERYKRSAAGVAQSVAVRLVTTILVLAEERVLIDGGLCVPDDCGGVERKRANEDDRRRHLVLL